MQITRRSKDDHITPKNGKGRSKVRLFETKKNKIREIHSCKRTPHLVMRLRRLARGRNALSRWEKLRPANGERATMKTKPKASAPGLEDATSEIQRDRRGKRRVKGKQGTLRFIKAGSVTWTWQGWRGTVGRVKRETT